MPEAPATPIEPRRLSGPLLLGILILPIVFVWFLLRPGYSVTLRLGAFAYTALGVAVGVIGSY
jgi:hypothetical protein